MIADHQRMKPYSLDLRQRVIQAVEQDHYTIAETAETFSVGTTFVKQMLRQWRHTGGLEPKPHGGGATASLNKGHLDVLARLVAKEPDITLEELRQHLQEQEQVEISVSTICRALQRLGLPLKKRV
jgi:transposase